MAQKQQRVEGRPQRASSSKRMHGPSTTWSPELIRFLVRNFIMKELTIRILFVSIVLIGCLFLPSCHRGTPVIRRYAFTGSVVSIDSRAQSALIDAAAIPGFMEAMAMSYKIKPISMLAQLAPGDTISAEVV